MCQAAYIGISVFLAACGVPVRGQAVQQQAAQAWFDQEWAKAQHFPDLEDYSFSWEVVQYSTLTKAEVDRLRDEVKDHPEHPDRPTLEAIERSHGGPIASQEFSLWSDRNGQWRYNSIASGMPGMYFDKALTGGVAWMLTPGVLNLVDPAREPPPGKDVKGEEHVFLPEIGALLNGGLTNAWLGSLQPSVLRLTDAGWSVEATLVGQVRDDIILALEYSGHWDSEHSRGFIDQMRITRSTATDGMGETRLVHDWHMDPVLNRWIASSVDIKTPQGVLERTIKFVSAQPVDVKTLGAVFAIPASGVDDPARGRVQLTQINDWRSGSLKMLKPGGSTTAQLPSTYTQTQRDRWQLIGWLLGASLVAGLIGLAVRKYIAHS